jgi:general secretion pathway protein I
VSGPRRGFTLLEVMVALALLAAAMMALSDLAGAALRNHEQARDLNAAVLLARAELARLEEKYQDQGFRDFDEEEGGDFSEEGRPDVRWKAELLRPSPDLGAERILSMLGPSGEKDDPGGLAAKLLGARAGPGGTSSPSAPAAMMSQLLQTQLTAFGEKVKKSLRELHLTVSWPAGRRTHSFTVVTHLVVLNPRAPGGARGDQPDVPPSVAAATAAAARAAAAISAGAPAAGSPFPGIPGPPKPAPKPAPKGK